MNRSLAPGDHKHRISDPRRESGLLLRRPPLPKKPFRPLLKCWRYSWEVTVCITLICREGGIGRIIVCTDTLLDAVSTSSQGMKSVLLGYTWFALLSGSDWTMATELAQAIRQRIQGQGCPTRKDIVFRTVESATVNFKSSPFCNPAQSVDLIVGGFIGDVPLLMYTGYTGGKPYTTMAFDMAVVGSGSQIAHTMLSLRGYNADMVSERVALYLAYEAKKYSENAPSVGPFQWMTIFKPNPSATKAGEVREAWVSDADVLRIYAQFEANRKQFGLQPINPAALPNLQSPTGDLSPPPPSPGSQEVW